MKFRTSKIKFLRFLVGQLPCLVLFIIFLNKDKITSSLLTYSILGMFVLFNIFINYYFYHEIKLEKFRSSPTSNQFIFLILSIMLSLIGIYRFFTAVEVYQKVLGFICLIVSLILAGLLSWGIKHSRDRVQKLSK